MMTRISPELAGRICIAFKAMKAAENAGGLLGAVFGLRDLLRIEKVDLDDLGQWIKDWAAYEQHLTDYADEVRTGVHQAVVEKAADTVDD